MARARVAVTTMMAIATAVGMVAATAAGASLEGSPQSVAPVVRHSTVRRPYPTVDYECTHGQGPSPCTFPCLHADLVNLVVPCGQPACPAM